MTRKSTPATKRVAGPDQCYCLVSRRHARHLTRLYERYLEPAGLTSSQFSILSFLDHQPSMTVTDLAVAMEMERTTLVRTLQPLKSEGLVTEGAVKQGRATVLHLSSLGLQKLVRGRPRWQAAQRAYEAEVGKTAAKHLREVANTVISHEHT